MGLGTSVVLEGSPHLGLENRGADLMSRGSSLPEERRLHPMVGERICFPPDATPTAHYGSPWCLRMIHALGWMRTHILYVLAKETPLCLLAASPHSGGSALPVGTVIRRDDPHTRGPALPPGMHMISCFQCLLSPNASQWVWRQARL